MERNGIEYLNFLKTPSSGVATIKVFKRRETIFIPDLFFIFFYGTVFLLNYVVDRIFIAYILVYMEAKYLSVIFIASALTPLIPLSMQRGYQKSSIYPNLRWYALSVVLTVFGLDPIYIGAEALKDITKLKQTSNTSKSNCLIHITHEKFFILKTYCYLITLIKIIPQIMWMPIFIIDSNLNEFGRFLALTSIMANILIFSFTIAITFPIRKSKAIYESCIFLMISCFSKFMATFCACCKVTLEQFSHKFDINRKKTLNESAPLFVSFPGSHLIIFAMVYRYIGFKVFVVLLAKFLLWSYPSYYNLSRQPHYLSRLHMFVKGLCLALTSIFIYIHPFHGIGEIFYYLFNLLTFLIEMFSIYAFSVSDHELTTVYLTLKVLVYGYVICFRVINALFTLRDEKETIFQDFDKITSQGA